MSDGPGGWQGSMLGTVKCFFSYYFSFLFEFFFFHGGSLLGNAAETMQAKVVFELAASSSVETVPQLTRQVSLGLSG